VSSKPGSATARREARQEVQEAIDTLTTSLATIDHAEKTGGTQ
jgi:hypothetical protein